MLELHQPIDPPLTELPEDAFDYWHPGVLEIGLRAVSYTHLDVYKRQPPDSRS